MTLADEAVDLSRIHRLADFEIAARATLDPAAYDYIAGGAWDEDSVAENEAAWRRRTLRPRVLVDVADVTTATTLLGVPSSMPVAIAPTATHGLAHPDGEPATARAAAAAGIPFILSTMSSRTIEEVAEAIPDATRWFQLYAQAEPRRTRRLVDRAVAAGYGAIVLTVDLPVLGYRERDRRNAFIPGPFGNFADEADEPEEGVDWLSRSLTWDDLATIRGWAPGLPLVLKGILGAEDARLAVEHGVDAIVVSNHGARQLDRVAAPVDVLEEVVDAAGGRTEIWVDGGVRRGLDVAIALALGARGVLLGRPALWALATGGQAGVERAIAILRAELEITLALLGAPSVADLTRAHVTPVSRGSA
jgi:isopentenyl diphosphate isomerase/L-lactate dehydrogenase-like FMN-dependent dehydrogenase